MFKPGWGICKCHNRAGLIVVKAGYCRIGNEEQKKAKKVERVQKLFEKKAKKESFGSLEKALDDWFSRWLRLFYADENGNCKCCTCGHYFSAKEIQDGHYESRRHHSLRWDEVNNHPQCFHCNVKLKGNYPKYAVFMVEKYGSGILQMLSIRAKSVSKIGRFEMKLLTGQYKNKAEIILKEKSIEKWW